MVLRKNMKICKHCGKLLHYKKFTVRRKTYKTYGPLVSRSYSSRCWRCQYLTAIAQLKEIIKERLANPGAKKRPNPVRSLIGNMIKDAKAVGILKAPPKCQCCKKKLKLQCHHRDYFKIYKVDWLCARCHAEVDNLEETNSYLHNLYNLAWELEKEGYPHYPIGNEKPRFYQPLHAY